MLDAIQNEIYKRVSDILWSGWDERKAENGIDIDCASITISEAQQHFFPNAEQHPLLLKRITANVLEEYEKKAIQAGADSLIIHSVFDSYRHLLARQWELEAETTRQGYINLLLQQKVYHLQGISQINDELKQMSPQPQAGRAHLENGIEQHSLSVYPKETLTVQEMAQMLRVSLPTMYKMVKENDFPALHVGRKILANKQAYATDVFQERQGGNHTALPCELHRC